VAGDTIELARLDTTAFTLAVINGGAGAGTLITMPVSVGLYTNYTFGGTNWTLTERRLLG
jgi:hypothetical protein